MKFFCPLTYTDIAPCFIVNYIQIGFVAKFEKETSKHLHILCSIRCTILDGSHGIYILNIEIQRHSSFVSNFREMGQFGGTKLIVHYSTL